MPCWLGLAGIAGLPLFLVVSHTSATKRVRMRMYKLRTRTVLPQMEGLVERCAFVFMR